MASVKRKFSFTVLVMIIVDIFNSLVPGTVTGEGFQRMFRTIQNGQNIGRRRPDGPGGRHLGDDAAELRAVLRERQQVADGAADGVDVVRRLDLLDQDLWAKRG